MNDGRQQLEQMLAARVMVLRDSLLRLRLGDAMALHDVRVAVRRLRASLAPWRDRRGFRSLRRPLRELARAMAGSGRLRDREVQQQGLRELLSPAAATAMTVTTALRPAPDVPDSLLARLNRRLARIWRDQDADDLIAVRDAHARRLLFRIQCALGQPALLLQLPDAIHVLRLDCKHLRYLIESLEAPALPALRAAQQVLGDLRDLDLLRVALAEAGSLTAAASARLRQRRAHLVQLAGNALQDLDGLSDADLS